MLFTEEHNTSTQNPSEFYKAHTHRLAWNKKPTNGFNNDLKNAKWFEDGELNACYNAIDRHCEKNGNKVAIIDSGNDGKTTPYTFLESKDKICEIASALLQLGVRKGDAVTIYLPMTATTLFATLACARLGVTHNVVFGGYSAESLRKRICDSKSKLVISCVSAFREKKKIEFLKTVLSAVEEEIKILVFEIDDENNKTKSEEKGNLPKRVATNPVSIHYFKDIPTTKDVSCVPVPAEHPLFYLYTSGSTGSPKGLVHTTGGYLLYVLMTLEVCFKFDSSSVMCCTADLGWITGHSYCLYGPLLLGATTVIVGGSPFFPTVFRTFEMIENLKVSHFYTAPTAIRVMKQLLGDSSNEKTSLNFCFDSLKVLGCVGEPISKETYEWYSKTFNNTPIIDTYFQTETGGFIITPILGVTDLIPECATQTFYGFKALLLRDVIKNEQSFSDQGNKIQVTNTTGSSILSRIENCPMHDLLLLEGAWPGMARTILNDHDRYVSNYFTEINGKIYFKTGDEASIDDRGYVWVRGRADDVLNVSGHRFSTAEIEGACYRSPGVREVAVVGVPDKITGQAIYVFLVGNEENKLGVRNAIRLCIGPIATPKKVIVCESIPKTRTGKIMRKVLRSILCKESVGDVSTCVNVEAIEQLKSMIIE